MDYTEFDIADFLADEYFVESVLRPSAESDAYWLYWLSQHPEKEKIVREARLMVLITETDQTVADTNLKDRLWSSIDQRTKETANLTFERTSEKDRTSRIGIKWYHIAAAVLLCLTFYQIAIHTMKPYSDLLVIENTRGKKSEFTLPDGTKVWLNAASKLSYPRSFNGKKVRNVVLKGEAFFDVTENKQQPFVVETEKIQIKVLGTAFNVKCYDDENTIETTLVRGKVVIEPIEKSRDLKPVVMKPNDQVVYSKTSKKLSLDHVKTESFTSWTKGKLVFNDEPFASIKTKLERWYGVEIDVENSEALNCRFSTTIQNEPITKILDLFKSTGNMTYELRSNQKLIIKGSLCKEISH